MGHSSNKVSYPSSHTSQTVECKLEEADPFKLKDQLSNIVEKSLKEFNARRVKLGEEPSISQLEQMADDALPYIASVLATPRVHRPKIIVVEAVVVETLKEYLGTS